MSKQFIFIIVATVLAGGIVVGVWYAVQKPGPRDLSMPPIYEEPGYTQPDDSIVEVPQDTVSYPHDDPDSPYIDLDAKLHVAKYVTLDSEIITINYDPKDVVLCGETYKVKQVMIDGVDVVQRYSTIMAEDKGKSDWFCELLKNHASDVGGNINHGEEIHITIGQEGLGYTIGISLGIGLINVRSGLSHSWSGGMGGIISPEKNSIITAGGYVFGTLR